MQRCSELQFLFLNLIDHPNKFIPEIQYIWKLENLWQVFNFLLSETAIRTHVRTETILLSKWASGRYESYNNVIHCLLFERSESCDGILITVDCAC